jgi:hypothetical protein
MKRAILILAILIPMHAMADKTPRMVKAEEAKAIAKLEVMKATVTLAKARAKLAEASAALAEAKAANKE